MRGRRVRPSGEWQRRRLRASSRRPYHDSSTVDLHLPLRCCPFCRSRSAAASSFCACCRACFSGTAMPSAGIWFHDASGRLASISVELSGEGGIRTLGTLASTLDFQSSTFDHSVTSPGFWARSRRNLAAGGESVNGRRRSWALSSRRAEICGIFGLIVSAWSSARVGFRALLPALRCSVRAVGAGSRRPAVRGCARPSLRCGRLRTA